MMERGRDVMPAISGTPLSSTEQKPKFVYGLFNNTGDGDEHYWHLGVCLTEEEAYEKFKDYLNHGAWIGGIEVC